VFGHGITYYEHLPICFAVVSLTVPPFALYARVEVFPDFWLALSGRTAIVYLFRKIPFSTLLHKYAQVLLQKEFDFKPLARVRLVRPTRLYLPASSFWPAGVPFKIGAVFPRRLRDLARACMFHVAGRSFPLLSHTRL